MKPTRRLLSLFPRMVGWSLVFLGFSLARAFAAEDGWRPLFDGQSLAGWKASENASSFKVRDGQIAAEGDRSHLFYVGQDGRADFRNFELALDVLSRPGANSGIYFHTAFQEKDWPGQGFEVQINNTQPKHGDYYEFKKTGSLYGVRNLFKSIVRDNEWFNVRIRVTGKRVRVWLNQQVVVDYVEAAQPLQHPEYEGRALGHGTFALQCHDPGSQVYFKNLRVLPLTAAADAEAGPSPMVDDYYLQVLKINQQNFPLVNLHAHLKGGLTLPGALEQARQSGINLGVAVNCGLNFAITNDAGIAAALPLLQGQPVFTAMQAEGREWVTLFSREAAAKFDYVFTDAMTVFNREGRRMRLWIKDETVVGEKQAFMEMLVDRTVEILTREPVDLYVNPTYLPEEIAKEYETLWTPERMQRVVDAAVKNNVAIEINARMRLPSPDFIKMAKQAGAKFSFGTNNGDQDIGRLDYCFRMMAECGLKADDMFLPKPDGQKAVQVKP